MARFRCWLARLILGRLPYVVIREYDLARCHDDLRNLRHYCEHSGALQDPARVKAYKHVRFLLDRISVDVANMELDAGWKDDGER